VLRPGQADHQPVRGREERGVHVDADRELLAALGIGEQLGGADPVERLLVEDLVRGPLVGAGKQRGYDGVFVRGFDVSRGGERTPDRPGHPRVGRLVSDGAGGRPQRAHRRTTTGVADT